MRTLLVLLPALGACIPLVNQPAAANPTTVAEPAVEIDPELAAWQPKQAEFDRQFAAELAAFRELEPRLQRGGRDAQLVADADRLRASFVQRCVAESHFSTVGCWNATFARDITEALVKLRLALGDKTGAYVEAYSLYGFPDLRSDKAKIDAARSGVDQQPLNIAAPDDVQPLEEQMDFVGEDIRSISRAKTTATIHFAARDSSSTGYSCGERTVVVVDDPTTASGNGLAVKQKCVASSHEEDHQIFPSVTVPLAEVEGVKAGQRAGVVFAKHTHVGHLLDVWPDGYTKQYIRIRTTRVKQADPGYP